MIHSTFDNVTENSVNAGKSHHKISKSTDIRNFFMQSILLYEYVYSPIWQTSNTENSKLKIT